MKRTRGISVQVYLNEEEYNRLCEISEKTGRTFSDLIRLMIKGYVVPEKPDKEFYSVIYQLLAACNQMKHDRTNDELVPEIKVLIESMKKNYLSIRQYDTHALTHSKKKVPPEKPEEL